ncbi:poly(A) polymerase protein [Dioscorea alata]|uniref:Poly(A) polymerase protein n=1 Tax=Dioscorea alata TaxID=55571 RepID=A0ACB7VPS0_DIOAL|nr:poly(A) polymerase protein [Dioscorea alata]
MAYTLPVQRRVVVPGQAPLIVVDPRTLVFSPVPQPPLPPVGYLPGAIPAIASPAFPGVVVAPVALRLNPASLLRIDEQRTHELIQFMVSEGLVPTPEEDMKRRDVMEQLKQIVLAWIKLVAGQHGLPEEVISSTSATILPFGSYGLGVHGSDSDIDALCIGPSFATLEEDFFVVLKNMIQSRPEVSEVHCVKSAKVPLMRFKFSGINIDFPYTQLQAISVPEFVDIFDPYLVVLNETSWRSLSGVRANIRILQLVPNLKNFQSMLRCIKLWARRRGVYSHLLGFFGGIHLAILAAHVCQRYPNASISVLIAIFFEYFWLWRWPEPVILQDSSIPFRYPDGRALMPILMPCSPFEWCNSNITKSTFTKIKTEFQRGHFLTRDLARPDFDWTFLFKPFPYVENYSHFLRILLTAHDGDELRDWAGWVKSRFRSLLLKLEAVQGYCDPNPTEYMDHNVAEPNVVFYWGLSPSGCFSTSVDAIKEDFMKSVNKDDTYSAYQGSTCKLDMLIVESCQLPKYIHLDKGSTKELMACEKILDYSNHMKPIYSQYTPQYSGGT